MKPRKIHFLAVLFCLICLTLSGCVPATPIAPTTVETTTIVSTVATTALTPAITLPTATQTALPTSTPLPPTPPPLVLNSETELIFTIRNDEPASPVMGTPWPDWLAWGAQAFTVAPDGSFWILDTTTATTDGFPQPRLLHYSPEGELLQTIPLEGKILWAEDVAVTEDKIWLLDLAPQPAQIAELDLNGQPLITYEIPEQFFVDEEIGYISNMYDNLYLGKEGELLLGREGSGTFLEILDAEGNLTATMLDGYPYGPYVYRFQGRVERDYLLFVNDAAVEVMPATSYSQAEVFQVDWLGVTEDGSFYVAVWEDVDEDPLNYSRFMRIVHAYNLSGNHLGVALLPESITPPTSRDLALGPDGALFALVSREDHSVDILRLGFTPPSELPLPAVRETPTPTPTPLTPLLPAWTTPPPDATDLEIARETLLAFFTALHDGRYAEAAGIYGGGYDQSLQVWVQDVDPNDHALLWENACGYLQCLLVSNIVEATQVAPDEFSIVVEFMYDENTRIYFSTACCGGNMADGAVYWQFPYTVKKIAGEMKVMGMPLYLP